MPGGIFTVTVSWTWALPRPEQAAQGSRTTRAGTRALLTRHVPTKDGPFHAGP